MFSIFRQLLTPLFTASALVAAAICHSEELRVESAESGVWIDPATADTCSVTNVREKWSRFAVLQHPDRLLRQDFEIGYGCFEGFNPQKVTVAAFPFDSHTGKKGDTPVWRFQTAGISGKIERLEMEGLYSVEAAGCCAGRDTTQYFSLATGEFLGASNNRLLNTDFERSHADTRRFVSVQENLSDIWEGTGNDLLRIYFFSTEHLLQCVNVTALKPDGEMYGGGVEKFVFQGQKECYDYQRATGNDDAVILGATCTLGDLSLTLPYSSSGFDLDASKKEGVEVTLTTLPVPLKPAGIRE